MLKCILIKLNTKLLVLNLWNLNKMNKSLIIGIVKGVLFTKRVCSNVLDNLVEKYLDTYYKDATSGYNGI